MLKRLHPRLHGVQYLHDKVQRLLSLLGLIPIPIKRRFQTRAAHDLCSCLMTDVAHCLPALFGDQAQRLFERVSDEVVRILDATRSP